jgi:hypothetical protein
MPVGLFSWASRQDRVTDFVRIALLDNFEVDKFQLAVRVGDQRASKDGDQCGHDKHAQEQRLTQHWAQYQRIVKENIENTGSDSI